MNDACNVWSVKAHAKSNCCKNNPQLSGFVKAVIIEFFTRSSVDDENIDSSFFIGVRR